MAKGKAKNLELVALQCTECDRRNYTTTKNRKNTQGKLEFTKYCRWGPEAHAPQGSEGKVRPGH